MRGFILLLALSATCALSAHDVRNLTDDRHISGPKLKPEDLEGKVLVVERWGKNCPPCRACLPHMAKLAKALSKDPRIVFIGSHVQGGDNAPIIDLLRANGCEYSVYHFFSVAGEPSSRGIPFAYVMNHKGEVVWEGHPGEDAKGMEEAAKKAAQLLPKPAPGSLVNGLAVEYCKDLARRLVVGKNVESVWPQLRARIRKGGPAGEEAQAILDRCEAWAKASEEAVHEALEATPSKALQIGKLYCRTFPKRAAPIAQELSALAKDPAVTRLATSRLNLEKLMQAPALTPNARKKALEKVKLQLRQLEQMAAKAPGSDIEDVIAQWKAYAEVLQAE